MNAVADEAPQHQVSLPPFVLGKYDVTRGEYAAFARQTGYPAGDGCGRGRAIFKWEKDPKVTWENPGNAQTDRDPVVCVSWQDPRAYIAWLNRNAHRGPVEIAPAINLSRLTVRIPSRSLEKEVHVDGVIRKYHATLGRLLQYACPKEHMNIAVNRADVALRPTRNFANSHRSLAGHQLEERPAFGRQRSPKKIFGGE
jgi:hypothetical protein